MYLAGKADEVGGAVHLAEHGIFGGGVPHTALTEAIQRFCHRQPEV